MALFFTLMLGLCVGVLGYFSYYFNYSNFVTESGTIIDIEINYLINDNPQDLEKIINSQKQDNKRIYILLDGEQNVIAGNIKKPPAVVKVLKEGTIVFKDDRGIFAAKAHLFDDGRTLIVGTDITKTAHDYFIMQMLSIFSIILMALVILTSFLISTFVVSRTNRIAGTAKQMMDTGDLSKRIALDSRWDDLSHMAFVLNAFLERVENLMQGIRQVSDNIAHDLRTPLTRLHNKLETLRKHPSITDSEEAKAICETMAVDISGLLDTFNSLLRIARVEAGDQRKSFESVDLNKIVTDVCELYEPLAQKKRITLSFTGEENSLRQGDPNLLFQAFANMVDNAIKFTQEEGQITITLLRHLDVFSIHIQDNGMGISDLDKPNVFRRFYRTDESRSTEGNGLGLALVAAIIDLHDGRIELKDAHPGLKIEITL
jgi:signal transduction histidine kinase